MANEKDKAPSGSVVEVKTPGYELILSYFQEKDPVRAWGEDVPVLVVETLKGQDAEIEALKAQAVATLHHAPSTLKTAARLLNEAIFANGSLSANDQAALRPLIAELLAAAE